MVDVDKDNLPNIIDGNVPKNYELCKEGDIVFADASEDTNEVAKAVEFYNLNGKEVVCGLHTIHGRDNNNKTVVGYKGYAFSSMLFHHQIRRIAQGTKIYSINSKNFSECYVGIPSKEEQKKIADLLRLIDERIATQSKAIEDLKKLKCAIAERLFKVTNGDVVSLSEVCNIQKGKQVNGDCLSETGSFYVMNGGTEPSGYYEQCNAPADTISISEGGNSCGYVQYNREAFWSGGHCYTLTDIQSNVCNMYLYHYLKSKESAIMKLRIGTGLPNIQKKDLEKFATLLPPIAKQVRISTFLTAIERKITNEEILLSHFQEEKQYLLRQMFI